MHCAHRQPSDFRPVTQPKDGPKIWRCSECGTEGPWTDTWGYYGSLECSRCGDCDMLFVACSVECGRKQARKHGVSAEVDPSEAEQEAAAERAVIVRQARESARAARAKEKALRAAAELSEDELRILLARRMGR